MELRRSEAELPLLKRSSEGDEGVLERLVQSDAGPREVGWPARRWSSGGDAEVVILGVREA
jgi:hypothetical protein